MVRSSTVSARPPIPANAIGQKHGKSCTTVLFPSARLDTLDRGRFRVAGVQDIAKPTVISRPNGSSSSMHKVIGLLAIGLNMAAGLTLSALLRRECQVADTVQRSRLPATSHLEVRARRGNTSACWYP